MKWGMRALAAVMIPLTASFPQGVFVYWVTTNVFSLFQATALRAPALKKLAGIPDVPVVHAAAAAPTAGSARKIAEKFGDAPVMHASNPKVRFPREASPLIDDGRFFFGAALFFFRVFSPRVCLSGGFSPRIVSVSPPDANDENRPER
jgi:hypothetical protein